MWAGWEDLARRLADALRISAVSRLYLGCISAASRLHLGCISAVSRLYLGCISAVSRLYELGSLISEAMASWQLEGLADYSEITRDKLVESHRRLEGAMSH